MIDDPQQLPAHVAVEGACDGAWLEACTMLGIMMSKGDGGSKNVSRAKEVLGFACERKFQNACYHLKKL